MAASPTRSDLATKFLEQLPYPPYPVQEEALLAYFYPSSAYVFW